MNINFEYDGVSASARLEEMATKKLDKLVDKYDFIVRADVFFKKEKSSDPEEGKVCNIRLSVPGPRLFAEASNDTFEESIAESTGELERQLKKKKEKMKSH
ncbi:ribosome-associated translation inhibitor RaiA [Zeaxanthinibacter sp. PT1]|uniref:ribosome hibernation-promoting factor, HPF/YfiA family n=1 Tax=Zeaxanthinibacter TaxID=561554 RepID=UPI00234B2F9E|nr:ribosome-associated translation inhibitor RaiA [Zeaxanthinibacter sp. PT1]MDC6351474.1 ribosome-associated translation inhibitor RaiA [Zeaxanthinibacter sp. PT1]